MNFPQDSYFYMEYKTWKVLKANKANMKVKMQYLPNWTLWGQPRSFLGKMQFYIF